MRRSQHGGIIFRLVFLLFLLGFAGGVYLIRHPLLRLAGRLLVTDDPIAHADAIIVLGDDNMTGDRAFRAADLFRAGWAPLVVASGRKLRPYAGMAEFIEKDLESDGVPAQSVLRFDHTAQDTREEAEALRGLAGSRHWSHLLVVTSNYHTRRAQYILRKVFPTQVSLQVISARDSDFDPDTWWESREGVKIFFLETAGYFQAVWELRGIAPGADPAGAGGQATVSPGTTPSAK